MKKLMRMMIAALIMTAMVGAAAEQAYLFEVTVAAGGTNGVKVVDLYKDGLGNSASAIDHIEFAVTSGTATGAVQAVIYDLGVASTSLASTAVPAAATQYTVYPLRTWSDANTNLTQSAYQVRAVRVTVEQPAGASASTWKGAIFTK